MKQPVIVGARPASEFKLTYKPANQASATFVAVIPGEIVVTRCLNDILGYPDDTPVVAHWHGHYRTDGFAMTVGELKVKAREFS